MLKFLMFLVFLVGSSIFVTEAFSLEVELQKESERIIESLGWLTPEKFAFQEQIQIIIDESNYKNRISIGIISTDPNDIIFTDNLEALSSNPKIISFSLTNKFACAPTKIHRACVIIEVVREGLGDDINEIVKNTREITDKIISDGVILFAPEFYAVTVQPRSNFDGSEKLIVSEALYTINKQTTENLFGTLATMLVSSDIRTAGGFFDYAEKLSEHYFSDFTIRFIPLGEYSLRSLNISLSCSNKIPEFPRCDPEGKIDEQIVRGDISPLDFIQVENINRSKIFADKFLPLNSVIQVLIFSEQDLQVKSVNSNVIEKLQDLGDIQESGWFFTSKSGKKN